MEKFGDVVIGQKEVSGVSRVVVATGKSPAENLRMKLVFKDESESEEMHPLPHQLMTYNGAELAKITMYVRGKKGRLTIRQE